MNITDLFLLMHGTNGEKEVIWNQMINMVNIFKILISKLFLCFNLLLIFLCIYVLLLFVSLFILA